MPDRGTRYHQAYYFMTRCAAYSVLIGLSLTALAHADGGSVRLSERQGEYQLTVFTSPAQVRVGGVDVSVLLQRATTDEVVHAGAVTVSVWPKANSAAIHHSEASFDAATNKLLRASHVELTSAEPWQLEITVDGLETPLRTSFEIEVAPAAPRWTVFWPWFTLPVVVILLFLIARPTAAR